MKIDYDCTVAKMAEQLGIPLWTAMEMMKYAKKRFNNEGKIILNFKSPIEPPSITWEDESNNPPPLPEE